MSGSTPKIFLVEDEMLSALYLASRLSLLGYPVTASFATGEEALARARLDPPELLLMDINLAGPMNGIEAASDIAALCGARTIFLSGYSDAGIVEKALALDPIAFLIKPIDMTELRSAIRRFVEAGRVGSV